jgi:hypothetical protein
VRCHPKTGHLLAWVHQEPTFWGGALLLTAEFVSAPWPVRAGDARRPVFLLLACCTQEDDEGGPPSEIPLHGTHRISSQKPEAQDWFRRTNLTMSCKHIRAIRDFPWHFC